MLKRLIPIVMTGLFICSPVFAKGGTIAAATGAGAKIAAPTISKIAPSVTKPATSTVSKITNTAVKVAPVVTSIIGVYVACEMNIICHDSVEEIPTGTYSEGKYYEKR